MLTECKLTRSETEESVHEVLDQINDPFLQQSYRSLGAIDSIRVDGSKVYVKLKLGIKVASQENAIAMLVRAALARAGIANCQVEVSSSVLHCPSRNKGNLSDVKNIVMVASGKGGVGKSTTAVNLALALQAEGAQVGIMDADIYGPSQRTMLGIPDGEKPDLIANQFLQPIERLGVKSMSVGYMSAAKTPMVWRGSMAVRALQQLFEQTLWGELDYLIVDMPPGTGDIQISLAQQFNIAGAVVVTTPQEVALVDARKGVEMFNKVNIPVLGVVENMATHVCAKCGHEESIFGSEGASCMALEYGVPVLGSLPLDKRICENADAGLPTVASDPTGTLARAFFDLANQTAAQLWKQNLEQSAGPEIRIVEI
ncbi:iron-sulfur cluster carrier protein ApbC [Marinimicrobium sp. ABcell2]|uniref:iron-sulfur cluster carrier protein ApbC n=1 Tax=Marinimicrobium sp. ABcell2 TaxID=3069751 RepID=UPI0027B24B2F|nr:iron-sulfur cluster carrier protein ApbC [Marinimicrobium sp. ABcell2]MDQ2078033.1 iron-sulfur cluster carrier protein ApbC [Marinimicrobium sp. ABcell2]